jgi:hypothetical protein
VKEEKKRWGVNGGRRGERLHCGRRFKEKREGSIQ